VLSVHSLEGILLPNGSRLSCGLRRPQVDPVPYHAAAAGRQLQALVRPHPKTIYRSSVNVPSSRASVPDPANEPVI